jgi:hypothetical protein
MIPKEYNIFYKTELPISSTWSDQKWNVFASAFNSSERVQLVFDRVNANQKYWLIHAEYHYQDNELPAGPRFRLAADEAQSIIAFVETIEKDAGRSIDQISICIDLTGFMRPHLLFLSLYLHRRGVPKFDVIYTEPDGYRAKEKTTFSQGAIVVRQVAGFEGLNSADHEDDLLIVGSGYDHRLIKAVAEHKDKADKVQIFGLPSLRADMYQENVLNAYKAEDAIGVNKSTDPNIYFAPANDPFVTASVLSEIVCRRRRIKPISNLYLSPLATKAQALGFALYFIGEGIDSSTNMLFPISSSYARETTYGLSRVWLYTIEYPLFE